MTSSKIPLVVCGAHLSGMPLNFQLLDRQAVCLRETRTAPCYRLYALPGEPRRPGLVRMETGGTAILVEEWAIDESRLGGFLAGISAPLGLGKVLLEDGTQATGFICEGYGIVGAEDITRFGGWRAYINSLETHA